MKDILLIKCKTTIEELHIEIDDLQKKNGIKYFNLFCIESHTLSMESLRKEL